MGNYKEESDEFEVDEPAELQENSEDEWAPAAKGKRSSTGSKRGAPASKKKKTEDTEDKPKKKVSKAKTPTKSKSETKAKTKQTKEKEEESAGDEEEEDYSDEEDEEDEADENLITPKEFSSGAFIVRKTDYNTLDVPPLWRIDGKALLQKYMPEKKDGKTLYKNTSSYSGWNINNKDQFIPATVVFKQQTRKDHIVEFQRDSMPKIPCA